MLCGMKARIRKWAAFESLFCGIFFGLALWGSGAGCAPNSFPKESLAFVRPGETTRADVIENFGTPEYDLADPHVIAYLKDTIGGNVPQSRLDRTASPLLFQDEKDPVGRETELLCFLLDAHDRVQRFGKVTIDGKTPTRTALNKWARGEPVGK